MPEVFGVLRGAGGGVMAQSWEIYLKGDAGIFLNPSFEKRPPYPPNEVIISPVMARAIARQLVKAARAWEGSRPFKAVKLSHNLLRSDGKLRKKAVVTYLRKS